jgi:glycine/D-amino acid oxidase-like deaminating enzyme
MTAQHNGFAAAAAGDGADLVRWQTGAPAADLVREYAAAAERVLAAFAAGDVLAREFVLPEISTRLRFPAGEMRALAQARGVQIHYGSPVLGVSASPDGTVVRTADRSWYAPVVVMAPGAWLEPLLGAQVPLPPLVVTQQQAFHFAPRVPADSLPVRPGL